MSSVLDDPLRRTLAARRPLGQPTRGKTARGRLRRVDTFVLLYAPGLVRRYDGTFARAVFVDLGYGAEPFTTLESADRFRSVNPKLRVVGVEIDPARVAAALPYADRLTAFRLGGFNLPLGEVEVAPGGPLPETVRLIRAFNVLRQYGEAEAAAAQALLVAQLLPGGLLIEGTSDPTGSTWVANLLTRPTFDPASIWRDAPPAGASSTPLPEALVFSTNFRHGWSPEAFQPVLPKNFIHRVVPGEPIHAFLEAWKQAYRLTLPERTWGPRRHFVAAARALEEAGWPVDVRSGWLARGYLVWRRPLAAVTHAHSEE